MGFTSITATLKHNHGMGKSDVEQGFERLNPTSDASVFKYSRQSPENQAWRGMPELDEDTGIPLYDPAD